MQHSSGVCLFWCSWAGGGMWALAVSCASVAACMHTTAAGGQLHLLAAKALALQTSVCRTWRFACCPKLLLVIAQRLKLFVRGCEECWMHR
jgi:hypothetical protein